MISKAADGQSGGTTPRLDCIIFSAPQQFISELIFSESTGHSRTFAHISIGLIARSLVCDGAALGRQMVRHEHRAGFGVLVSVAVFGLVRYIPEIPDISIQRMCSHSHRGKRRDPASRGSVLLVYIGVRGQRLQSQLTSDIFAGFSQLVGPVGALNRLR